MDTKADSSSLNANARESDQDRAVRLALLKRDTEWMDAFAAAARERGTMSLKELPLVAPITPSAVRRVLGILAGVDRAAEARHWGKQLDEMRKRAEGQGEDLSAMHDLLNRAREALFGVERAAKRCRRLSQERRLEEIKRIDQVVGTAITNTINRPPSRLR